MGMDDLVIGGQKDVERCDDFDLSAGDEQFLPRFPQARFDRGLPSLDPSAWETDLPRLAVERTGAHLKEESIPFG